MFTELTTARNPHQGEALAELAKYFEHREKNYSMALDMTEAAMQLGTTEELTRRLERLQKRAAARRSGRLI